MRAAGLFLIKSWLLYLTQEDLITFYAGVCLIVWLLPHWAHAPATPLPNQLVSAAASLQLICNSHSKAWWQSSSLMTIHQDSVMRGAVETCGPYGCPLRWHLQGHGEAIVSKEATPTLILRLRFETVEKIWLWDQKVARSAWQYLCFGGFHLRLKILPTGNFHGGDSHGAENIPQLSSSSEYLILRKRQKYKNKNHQFKINRLTEQRRWRAMPPVWLMPDRHLV